MALHPNLMPRPPASCPPQPTAACSSSLVATHGALDALRLSQCSSATAAGANLCLMPDTFAMFQLAGECYVSMG